MAVAGHAPSEKKVEKEMLQVQFPPKWEKTVEKMKKAALPRALIKEPLECKDRLSNIARPFSRLPTLCKAQWDRVLFAIHPVRTRVEILCTELASVRRASQDNRK